VSALFTITKKELRDNLRDKRSMTSALIMPMIGALVFVLMTNMIAGLEGRDKPLVIPVAGAQNAPNLVGFLRRAGATVTDAPADFERKVQDGELDLVLTIPADYGKSFAAGRTATLELTVDNSRNQSHGTIRRVRNLLEAYSDGLGALRLFARGVSPALARPVTVDENDLATPEKMAGFALAMIPMFLLITAFIGGMYLAIDATAGERERGSLEPLLLNPVSLRDIVLGKWAAVVVTGFGALGVATAAFAVALRRAPLHELGVRAELGMTQVLEGALVLVPLVLFAAALQILVSLFARTYKEAQTYLSLLLLVPTLPTSLLSLSNLRPQTWMMATPMWGQSLMLNAIVRGDAIPPVHYALGAVSALLLTSACLMFATRLLGRETTVFGRTQAGA
jgi:sodium transport system permease protein